MRAALAAVVLGALAPAALAPAAAATTAFPPFPASPGATAVGRWLASQTDLPIGDVVLVGPGYVFAFTPPDPPDQGGLVWKSVREEITNTTMAVRLGGRSASAVVAFDCAKNEATASDVMVWTGNSFKGDMGRAIPAADWLTATPGLYLMDLAKAACDPAYRRPFAGAQVQAAAPSGPASVTTDPEYPSAAPVRAARPAPSEAGAVHWVQIGAFASPVAARQRWAAIQRLLPAQSAGRGLKTEPVGGGKTLVRALAGPFKGATAGQFCAALEAKGGDCLVR